MKLAASRSLLEEMKVVFLHNPEMTGPNPVYQVFTDLNDHFWVNKTVISPGRLGDEYTLTFGHYHGVDVPEKYYVAQGKGVLQLQKKHIGNNVWMPEVVDEALLIKAETGDEVVITPEYGHSWSNVGKNELVLFDNWSSPHCPTDYEAIEKLHGLAYYLIEDNGETKTVPNPNYRNLPEPKWLTTGEFNGYRGR